MPGLSFLTLRRGTMRRFMLAIAAIAVIGSTEAAAQLILYVTNGQTLVTKVPPVGFGSPSTYATGLNLVREWPPCAREPVRR